MENTEISINFIDKSVEISRKICSNFEVNENKLESSNETDTVTGNSQAQSAIIKPINGEVVHKICSGQVVLNLAIAVKELVENALDAGATNIEIRLKEHGSELIEVIDNGCGVLQQNFAALTLKHHTSKIKKFTDLESVETLGFRGEALSSLCALSNVSIITRHNSLNVGTKLEYDHNGKIVKETPIARSEGTTVTLSNIFSTLPVRRKEFMKNIKREFNKMCQLLYAYCLVCVNTKIICINQNNKGGKSVVIATQASPTVRENIISVFGAKQISSLIDITLVEPTEAILEEYGLKMALKEEIPFTFEYFISSVMHGSGRSTTDRQFYYINSRPCEPTKIMKLTNEIYRQFNSNQYPFVYLNILMERKHVDVNVTPDKRQIFLDKEKLLLAVLKSSLLDAFKNFPSTFKMQNLDIGKRKETQTILNETLKGLKRTHTEICGPPTQESLLECFKKKIKKNESAKEDLSKFVIQKSPLKEVMDDKVQDGLDSKKLEALIDKFENTEEEKVVQSLVDCKYVANGDKMVDTKLISEVVDITLDDAKMGQNMPNIEIASDATLKEILTINAIDLPCTSTKLPENKQIPICKVDFISLNKNEKITILNTTFESIEENIRKKLENESNEQKEVFVKFRSKIAPNCNKEAERELQKQITKDKFKEMEIIGQFNLGFIIGKLENDLFIIDQHATDEKYNYEQLQMNTVLETQILVNPKPLQLTAANESLLIESLEIFRKNGFQFDIDQKAEATKKIKLTAIPVSKNYSFGKDDIDELLFMLQDGSNTMCRPSRVGQMFASRACRKSVMIGKSLTETDMRRLIDHMGEIEQPWNCPHGRPTMRHLINLNLIDEK